MQEQRTTAALSSLAPKSVAKVCVSLSLLSYFYLKTNGPNSSPIPSFLPSANLQSLGTGPAHSFVCPSLSCVAQSTYKSSSIHFIAL